MTDELAVVPGGHSVHDLVPFEQMAQRLEQRRAFIQQQLKAGIDYGVVPGVRKPFMWKSGAEKLLELHGLMPQLERVDSVEDRNTSPPYFEFTYRCDLIHVATQTVVRLGAEGTCNNRERKYFDDRDGTSKGDPWVQRNTCVKMAQKRALVAGSLMVTSLSCDFTQDEEAVEVQRDPGHGPAASGSAPPAATGGTAPAAAVTPTTAFQPPAVANDGSIGAELEAPASAAPPQQQQQNPVIQNPAGKCSDKQAKYIFRLCKEGGIEIADMLGNMQSAYGPHIQRFDDLTKQEASDVIASMVPQQGK